MLAWTNQIKQSLVVAGLYYSQRWWWYSRLPAVLPPAKTLSASANCASIQLCLWAESTGWVYASWTAPPQAPNLDAKKPPLTYLAAHGEVAPVVGVNTHKVSLPAFLNQIGLFTFLLDAHFLLWTLQPADTQVIHFIIYHSPECRLHAAACVLQAPPCGVQSMMHLGTTLCVVNKRLTFVNSMYLKCKGVCSHDNTTHVRHRL